MIVRATAPASDPTMQPFWFELQGLGLIGGIGGNARGSRQNIVIAARSYIACQTLFSYGPCGSAAGGLPSASFPQFGERSSVGTSQLDQDLCASGFLQRRVKFQK
jgi:hypothetical protein